MIGELRHKVKITTISVSSRFGFESDVKTETTYLETFASIKEISRKDKSLLGLNVEADQYEVIIRGVNRNRVVSKDMYLEWRSSKYRIRTAPKLIDINNALYYKFIITREL